MPKTVSKPNESGKSVDSKNQHSSYLPIFLFFGNPNFIHPSIHPSIRHPSMRHPSMRHPSMRHPSIHHPSSILHSSSFGRPLGSLWSSLGSLLPSFGVPLGSLWGALAICGVPLGHLWCPIGVSSGSFVIGHHLLISATICASRCSATV